MGQNRHSTIEEEHRRIERPPKCPRCRKVVDQYGSRCPFCCTDFVVLHLSGGPYPALEESLTSLWQGFRSDYEASRDSWYAAVMEIPDHIQRMESFYSRACSSHEESALRGDFGRHWPVWLLAICGFTVVAGLSAPLAVQYFTVQPPVTLELSTKLLNLNVLGAHIFAVAFPIWCILMFLTVRRWIAWSAVKASVLPEARRLAQRLDGLLMRLPTVRDDAHDLAEVDQQLGDRRKGDVPAELPRFRSAVRCRTEALFSPMPEWPMMLEEVRRYIQPFKTDVPNFGAAREIPACDRPLNPAGGTAPPPLPDHS